MKRRILFVDDDPLVLGGLRRLMRGQREDWEPTFAQSGAEALACMESQAYDVVVTDMKMPAMHGVALLEEVMRRRPETARLVLSGHADPELMARCVGVAHQCLSKPCEPEALWRTIGRAASPGGSSQAGAVRRLIAGLVRVPSIPEAYLEMMEVLRQPDAEIEAVTAVVEKDPGLTTRLLQLVNSAFFGLGQTVISPQEAVTYLGLNTVRSLVLSLQTFSQYEGPEQSGVSVAAVWQHSLRTGQAARRLAVAEGASHQTAEAAFVGGLLHDVGRLVMASGRDGDYAAVAALAQQRGVSWLEAERELYGCTHADVGGYLLGLWGLPPAVVDAISFHHEPELSGDEAFSATTAVHVANALDDPGPGANSGAANGAVLNPAYLGSLGLTADAEFWRSRMAE